MATVEFVEIRKSITPIFLKAERKNNLGVPKTDTKHVDKKTGQKFFHGLGTLYLKVIGEDIVLDTRYLERVLVVNPDFSTSIVENPTRLTEIGETVLFVNRQSRRLLKVTRLGDDVEAPPFLPSRVSMRYSVPRTEHNP